MSTRVNAKRATQLGPLTRTIHWLIPFPCSHTLWRQLGYLDESTHDYWWQCVVCGKKQAEGIAGFLDGLAKVRQEVTEEFQEMRDKEETK